MGWLANPVLMEADEGAQYLKTYEIDLADITEPILCCPNDPDDAKTLSEIGTEKIDEVFIGSCMTNIGHFRAAGELLKSFGGVVPTRLWVAPPTKMDEAQLTAEGFYSVYGSAGARTDARLLAVHGQPSTRSSEVYSGIHIHSKFPQ